MKTYISGVKKTVYKKRKKFIYLYFYVNLLHQSGTGIPTSHCTENPMYAFPEMKLRGLVSVSVSNLYIPMIGPPICCRKIGGPSMGIYKSLSKIHEKKFRDRPL